MESMAIAHPRRAKGLRRLADRYWALRTKQVSSDGEQRLSSCQPCFSFAVVASEAGMEQLMPTEGSTVEPEVPREKLTIEVSVEVLERVDAWRSQQADKPSRE